MVTLIAGYVDRRSTGPDPGRVHAMLDEMTPAGIASSKAVSVSGAAVLGRVELGPSDAPGCVNPEIPTATSGLVLVGDVWLHVPIPTAESSTAGAQASAAGAAETDEAALLQRFTSHGADGLGELRGDFAFAAWEPNAGRLTLGKDHFGVRPLFYCQPQEGVIAFASLDRALTAGGFVSGAIDRQVVEEFAVRHHTRADASFLVGSKKLPGGHVLLDAGAGTALQRYWTVPTPERLAKSVTFEDCAGELRVLLDQAVERRIPERGRISAHLSGGLDSSSIAVLAARVIAADDRSLTGYAFVARSDLPADAIVDERPWVQAVVDAEPNIDIAWVEPPPIVERLFPTFGPDRPTPVNPADPEQQVARGAAGQGSTIVLSGWGGDEGATHNGRQGHAELARRGRWVLLLRELAAWRRNTGGTWLRVLWSLVVAPMLPDHVVERAKRLAGSSQPTPRRNRTDKTREAHVQKSHAAMSMVSNTRENRNTLLASPHIQHRLENWAYVGAQHGIRYAFPMLDVDLANYAMRIPTDYFIRGGIRRSVFRQAIIGVLPEAVRMRRPKLRPFPCMDYSIAESGDLLTDLARKSIGEHGESAPGPRRTIIENLATFDTPPQVLEHMRSAATRGDQHDSLITMSLGELSLEKFLSGDGAEAI